MDSNVSPSGKLAVVTGAGAGIGKIVAQRLAERGVRLALVVRDPAKGAFVRDLPRPPGGQHRVYRADLFSMAETRRVAAEIADAEPAIDILINNAGAVFEARQETVDGLERTFALNHMAYFVMTLGLLDRLKAAGQGRVVTTASRMHASYALDFDDLQNARGYDGYTAYGRSKLCNILFARALAKRLEGTRVTSNALHPGFVRTAFGDGDRSRMGRLVHWMKIIAITPEKGALTTLHAALSEEGGRLTGAYFVKSKPAEPSRAALNDADAERLWTMSEDIAGMRM